MQIWDYRTEKRMSLRKEAEKAVAPHSSTLAWKIHGRRSLVGCSPWGREESDTTEWLHFHFSLSCVEEGNGNRLQCSCLENPRDGGAWWAAVYGVAQSRTRLKRLSSSSSSKKRRLFKHKLKYVFQGIIFLKKTGYTKVPNQAVVWVEQEQSETYRRA